MNFFKKKNDVDWKWIAKKYLELGEYRIINDVDGNPMIQRNTHNDLWGWMDCEILRKDQMEPVTNLTIDELKEYIYTWRYNKMKMIKSIWTYKKRVSKALYIPPKKDK